MFGGIPSRNLPARPEFRLQPMTPEIFGLQTDLAYGLAVMSFRMPGSDDPDFAAAYVLADVLSSRRSERYAFVPAGKALSAAFSLSSLPKAGSKPGQLRDIDSDGRRRPSDCLGAPPSSSDVFAGAFPQLCPRSASLRRVLSVRLLTTPSRMRKTSRL